MNAICNNNFDDSEFLEKIDDLPAEEEVVGWGELLNCLLGSDEQGKAEFSFPWISRRVETINLLNPDGKGQRRDVSLDINNLKLIDCFNNFEKNLKIKNEWVGEEEGHPTKNWQQVHVPFAIFSKNLIIDFSAESDEGKPLVLEQKEICYRAGFCWLLESIPSSKIIESDLLYKWLWWLCRLENEDFGENPGSEDKPGYSVWYDFSKASFLRDADQAAKERLEIDLVNLSIEGDGKFTSFYQRLQLLTVNYFPLLLIPAPTSTLARSIIKMSFIAGKPFPKWYQETRKIINNNTNFLSRNIIQIEKWPYETDLFGSLEGHCEHLHISIPRGIQLAEPPKTKDMESAKSPKPYPIEMILRPNVNVFRDNRELLGEETIEAQRKSTQAMFFRRSLIIRRHKSFEEGEGKVRFWLLPSLEGIFGPLLLSLIIATVNLIMTMSTFKGELSNSTSFNVFTLLTTVAATVTRITDQPLRKLFLTRLYAWIFIVITACGVFPYVLVWEKNSFLKDLEIFYIHSSILLNILLGGLIFSGWIYFIVSCIKIHWSAKFIDNGQGESKNIDIKHGESRNIGW